MERTDRSDCHRPILAIFLAVNLCVICASARAQTGPCYNGKTVRIIVGSTPGGFYDRWARLLARYIPLHIQGNPGFVVQNMPGASLVVAANYVYMAKPDGLTMVMPINSLQLHQIVVSAKSNTTSASLTISAAKKKPRR